MDPALPGGSSYTVYFIYPAENVHQSLNLAVLCVCHGKFQVRAIRTLVCTRELDDVIHSDWPVSNIHLRVDQCFYVFE